MAHHKRDDRMSRSVSRLVSMLVRYPEVGSVNYDPVRQTIRLGLLITGELTPEDQERTEATLFDTLEVYHMLEQRNPSGLDVEWESFGSLTAVAVTRDAASLSPEEIYTIIEFFRERLPGRLISEAVEYPGEEELLAQDEMIEEIVLDIGSGRTGRNLIAIREDGRVMVFQK